MTPVAAAVFDCFGLLLGDGMRAFRIRDAATRAAVLAAQQAADTGAITGPEADARIAAALGLSPTEFEAGLARGETPDRTLFDFVRGLRPRLRTGLLSNVSSRARIEQRLPPELALDRHFDAVVVSGEAGVAKPDPGIYRIMLDRLGVPAEATVYVDDSAANVRAARSLGMRGLRYRGFEAFAADFAALDSAG